MEDRFTRGFIAGLVGVLAMNLFNFISYYVLQFAKARQLDYAGVLIFSHQPITFIEEAVSLLAQILFSAFLGSIFVLSITTTSNQNYYFKGWIFSVITWFTVFIIGTLFKVPLIDAPKAETVVSNLIASSIYGFIWAYTLSLLDNHYNEQKEAKDTAPKR